MLVDGAGTMAASLFGSPFPTTVYIGHQGWKGMGARSGYSWLNGVVMAVLLCIGAIAAVNTIIPMSAGAPILIYIGMVICAHAFQTTPQHHMPAVVLGFIPVLAAWGLVIAGQLAGGMGHASPDGDTIGAALKTGNEAFTTVGLDLLGSKLLSDGALITSMVLVSMVVFIRDRDFYKSAIAAFCGAAMTVLGFMHGTLVLDQATMENNIQLVLMYLASGCLLLFIHEYTKQKDIPSRRQTTEVWDWDANVKTRLGKE
jgi:AGZA family xanthine/uracil permease-like MFS transporter